MGDYKVTSTMVHSPLSIYYIANSLTFTTLMTYVTSTSMQLTQ